MRAPSRFGMAMGRASWLAGRRSSSARWPLPAAVVAGLLTVGALGGCGSSRPGSRGAASSAPETATASSTTVAPTASHAPPATSAKTTTAPALPVVVCPTVIAITPPPGSIPQPGSMAASVPDRLAGRLAVYTDDRGTMRLIGPRHWSCRAFYGADGSGGVAVYPTGQPIPSDWGAGWKLPSTSTVQAVIGIETSACAGCSEGQACPLFTSAAKDFLDGFGRPCPTTRPTAENLDHLGAGVVAFEDPPPV